MSDYDINVQQTVLEEIAKLPGQKRTLGDTIQVCCPFHDDRTPSLGIFVAMGMEIPFGFFNCLGCDAKGMWNRLAEKAGLQTIKQWQAIESEGSDLKNKFKKSDDELLGQLPETKKVLLNSLGTVSLFPWSKQKEWRGVPGELIHDCEGMFHVGLDDEINCFFPIAIGNKYKGGVKAYLEKEKGRSSYINTRGSWIKDVGLFPYNLVKNNIQKYGLNYVILVEGPRDPLRLIIEGMPALAILGGKNFTEKKLNLLMALGIETLYVMSDNDKGGKLMRKIVKEIVGNKIPIKMIRLPEDLDKKGNLIKMDPENAPKGIIKEVKAALRKKHGLFPRKYKVKKSEKVKCGT